MAADDRISRRAKKKTASRGERLEMNSKLFGAHIASYRRAAELSDLQSQTILKLAELNAALIAEIAQGRHAAEMLSESRERYCSMADATPVLIWESGPDKRCTYFNKGWLEFTGRSLEQELGEGWTEGVHPDDLRHGLDLYASAFDRREPFLIEYRLRHRSGEYRWILDAGTPQFSSNGTFLGYIGGAVDTHDQKLAEQALRRSQEQVRQSLKFNQAVMASMGEGLYTLDAQGLVTYINPAAEKLFGWSSAELLGRKMHDATHYRHPDGSPFPADECPGLQVLEKGRVLSNQEDVFIHKDGTFFDVIYSAAPLKSDDGAMTGLVVVFRDISARKRTEKELHRSREELRALAARLQAAREEERTALAREIHDELSGTLTVLKMDLFLLSNQAAKDTDLFSKKLTAMSELIDRTLERVHGMITELRPIVLSTLGLPAAIEWQTGVFQQHSGIACEAHMPDKDVRLDPQRSTAVFRIFQESLTNVARHAQASKVIVELKHEAQELILTVRDNGKGIDEAVIHARESIGLLGMRERALSFGGSTEFIALPEGGTCVTVRVPLDPRDALSPAAPSNDPVENPALAPRDVT